MYTYIHIYIQTYTHLAAVLESYYSRTTEQSEYGVGARGAAGGISASVLTGRAIATAARR
jgi:hypothetical protein